MDLCQTSYALGSISAARSSLTSAQRALERNRSEGQSVADARAMLALEKALCLLETAIHELGSDIVAHRLTSRTAA